ncbi:hypothetical protein FJO69_00295 [[Mycoplasma] falconis]|uniref:Uncharacterized protein n=1 Tax=[Mycoplasma] falconis TaxID=92403 RepID=A0A501XBP1_9BACT|nr:hypothetical protein [[Mycoplasma] falconis]TPE58038.1 hypothetical protein FJO69_00295 [[Mycoplasma] falconis]
MENNNNKKYDDIDLMLVKISKNVAKERKLKILKNIGISISIIAGLIFVILGIYGIVGTIIGTIKVGI